MTINDFMKSFDEKQVFTIHFNENDLDRIPISMSDHLRYSSSIFGTYEYFYNKLRKFIMNNKVTRVSTTIEERGFEIDRNPIFNCYYDNGVDDKTMILVEIDDYKSSTTIM